LFNGQASSISVGRSRSYVSSLEPRLAEGAVGFAPITSQADSGVYMFVDGTISADRKYVTLTVDVRQRDEPTLERFEVQRASGNSPGAFISLPDYTFATLSTTVSIPDGGTVLLGGLKQVGEVETEAGVPILSKIPVLKRAFTNQTSLKDTRTLLILVKTKIIIQKEAEEEAFPTFTRTGT
jgi:type II secretory pathway component GspD/PulD (secretin)